MNIVALLLIGLASFCTLGKLKALLCLLIINFCYIQVFNKFFVE